MANPRSLVRIEDTYRTEDIFATPEEFTAELSAILLALPQVTRYAGRLHESPQTLYECLVELDRIMIRAGRAVNYGRLRYMTDGGNSEWAFQATQGADIQAQVAHATGFVKSELVALDSDTLAGWAKDEPKLSEFSSLFREVALARGHTLGSEAEGAIASLATLKRAPSDVYNAATTGDMVFSPAHDSDGNEFSVSLMGVMMHTEVSPDTELRRSGYDSMMKALTPYRHTLAQSLAAHIKGNLALSRLRKYPDVFTMMLSESAGHNVPDEIPVSVFDNVLDVLQKEMSPHFQRYARLRKKVLGLDRLLFADQKAGLDPDYHPELTLKQVEEWIVAAVTPMGEEYVKTVKRAFAERWIDHADNIGRQGGASCTTPYGVHPFIFSVFTGSMHSAFTLAHELGHAVHGVYRTANQRFINARGSNFAGEAPSCFIPQLLAEHLKKNTTDMRFKRAVLMEEMNTYHHEFVTHLLEAELLRRLYWRAERGESLGEKVITGQKADVLRKFWGDSVEIQDIDGIAWIRQPHYYMNLYPYAYSVGLTVATLAAEMIEREGAPARSRWIEMMKAGSSLPALGLFRLVGIDMSTEEPLKKMAAHVGKVVTELEATFEG